MPDTVPQPELHSIPRFAVVGRVNKGKSSILATLVEEADNEHIRISSIPGETTRCYSIPLKLAGETLIEFIDTPGFSRARQTLQWLKDHHPSDGSEARIDTVRRFVREFRDEPDFMDECLLLEPVLDGAGIVYVVDSSKPFRPDFGAEMEILRWTGRPRMAVLNNISETTDFGEEWRERLGETFNLTREFNAHQARFKERIRLLRHLLEIDDRGREQIERTIWLLEADWVDRRGRAADIIMDLLSSCLRKKTCRTVSSGDLDRDYQRKRIEQDLKERYKKDIQQLELDHHKRMGRLYRHEKLQVTEALDDSALVIGEDLFAEETWKVLGLNRNQLAMASAIAGGGAGLAIDAATGGLTGGAATVLGAGVGYLAAHFKGRALAEIKISNPLSPTGHIPAGGVQLCAGPPSNLNFPWILLDRILFHYHHLIVRAHGRRDDFVIDFSHLGEGEKRLGYAVKFSSERRRVLQTWLAAQAKGKSVDEDSKVFGELEETLNEIEEQELLLPGE